MASIYHNVPRDVQLALTQFSSDFDAAFAVGDVEQWAGMIGTVLVSDAIRTTWPIPLSTAGYKLRDGDDKMRRLYERSMSMTPLEWVDGVSEKARIIEADTGDFIGWLNEPAQMAQEAVRHPNVLVADMLASNPYLDFYRIDRPGGSVASAKGLFNATHPVNVLDTSFGTFDNDWGNGDTVQGLTVPSEINATLVKICRQHFRSIKRPNGTPLGLRFAGFLVPAAHEEEALDAFARDTIVDLVKNVAGTENVGGAAMPNRFLNTAVTVADELTGTLPSGATGDDDVIYAYATKEGGATPSPWVVQRSAAPEQIIYTKDDQLYKDAGLVGIKFVLQAAAAPALPHAIVRINLSV
jgi:hypothetical protein